MSNINVPFNITIFDLPPEKLKGIKPVTSLDIFDETKKNFDEDGFYSVGIFGRFGDEVRDFRFSYIDIKIEIFHPILFKVITNLKALYHDIMSGKEYAKWNDELKDFERASALDGETGFYFFMQHWKDIQFKQSESDLREQYILLVEKFKNIATTSKVLVLPAGLREIEFTDNGRSEENEITVLYRKLLSISNVISESSIKFNPEMVNSARWSLQNTFNQIYDVFASIIEGKKKLVQGKWASRKVFNGTRNVITSMNPSTPVLGDENALDFNASIVGLFQYSKSILPVTKYRMKNEILSKIFLGKDIPTKLVNMKTLAAEEKYLSVDDYDRWTSDEGVEKTIELFREEAIRHKPVIVDGSYLALVYKGPDDTFKIIQDINDVPEEKSRENVFPMTYAELIYLSIYEVSSKYPGFITRYPIASFGSIYPTKLYLKTTNKAEIRYPLNDSWEIDTTKKVANEFPINGVSFMNSLSPGISRIKNLNADYDRKNSKVIAY